VGCIVFSSVTWERWRAERNYYAIPRIAAKKVGPARRAVKRAVKKRELKKLGVTPKPGRRIGGTKKERYLFWEDAMGKKQPVIQVMWAVPEAVTDAQVRETLIQLVRSKRYYDLPEVWDVWIHLEEYGAMKDWRWSQALTESAKNGPGFDALIIAHLGGKLAKRKATEAERKLSKRLSRSARKRLPR
jgi:hypothetical protein